MLPTIELQIFNQLISLRTYDTFIVVSIAIGLVMSFITLKQYGLNIKTILFIYLCITISFIIGARLLHFSLQYKTYNQLGLSLFTFKFAYFSLYGGVILSFVTLLIIIKILKLKPLDILDKLTLPFLLSFFVMKIGCFLNGCCYGKATKSWFSVPLPVNQQTCLSNSSIFKSIFGNPTIRVYPTQLMEGFGALFILIFLYIIRKRLTSGQTFYASAALFSALRFIVLFYRQLPYSDFVITYFYPILYLLIIVGASLQLTLAHKS